MSRTKPRRLLVILWLVCLAVVSAVPWTYGVAAVLVTVFLHFALTEEDPSSAENR